MDFSSLLHLPFMKFLNISIVATALNVMVILAVVAFYYIPERHESKNFKLFKTVTSLATAEKLAVEDFNSGKRQIAVSGFQYLKDAHMIRDSILFAEYKVTVVYLGNTGLTEEERRYSQTMMDLLASTHGRDFFADAERRAKMMLKKRGVATLKGS